MTDVVDPIDYLEELVTVAHGHTLYSELMTATVQKARLAGISWERIAEALGVSRQAAQQRFGPRMKPMPPLKRGPRKRTKWDEQ